MRALQLATVQAEDAQRVATADRQVAADRVLRVAIDEALALVREGRVGYAEYRLARAEQSARRILGDSTGAPS